MRERLSVDLGDITEQQVDAIVNAANSSLLGGGGVDGAIHRAAGPGLLEECRALGGCPTGEARLTGGHDLPARQVIHAVGPIWRGGHAGEEIVLAGAYHSSLVLARDHALHAVAFPAISTGIFGYPLERATAIAVDTVWSFLEGSSLPQHVTFVCFDERTRDAYDAALRARAEA